ncbi:MAG: exodeoxyribonuclease III [Treponema sp.]|nr:exodeoxyribonuclease III [Treponema sp.]
MKIISWNVNGIRAVEKKGFVNWLLSTQADVVCIQETKANPSQLSPELLSPTDSSTGVSYKSYFNSSVVKAGYSGTAIYCKQEPDSVENLGDATFDDEGRVTIVKIGTTAIISAYFPNSQDDVDENGKPNHPRLEYKLAFNKAIHKKCDELVASGFNIVLCGDYNVAHKPIDLANPKTNEKHAGYLQEERDWMDSFLNSGYVDSFRHFCQEPGQYTWWSYRFHAREKNVGWRLDYQCVNPAFVEKLKSATILKDVMGSDHCPVEIEVAE